MNLHFSKGKLAAFVRSTTLVLSLPVTFSPQLIVPAMADVGVGINGGVVSFDQPGDASTPFMFHRHILEHEDAGMMAQYNSLVFNHFGST